MPILFYLTPLLVSVVSLLTFLRFGSFVFFIINLDEGTPTRGKNKALLTYTCYFSAVVCFLIMGIRWHLKKNPGMAVGGGKPDQFVLF